MKIFHMCLVATALLASLAAAAERPNIILVFTDDQSYFSTGATGNDQVTTPNMDRLATEGVVSKLHHE